MLNIQPFFIIQQNITAVFREVYSYPLLEQTGSSVSSTS